MKIINISQFHKYNHRNVPYSNDTTKTFNTNNTNRIKYQDIPFYGSIAQFDAFVLKKKQKTPYNIPLDNTKLKIDKETIKKYLLNSEGEIDKKLTEKFQTIFKIEAEKYTKLAQEKKDKFNSILADDTENKIRSINSDDEIIEAMLKASDEFEMINSIKDDFARKEFARELSENFKETETDPNLTAYKNTIDFFEISKTPDGYDFSDTKEKLALISKARQIEEKSSENSDFISDIVFNSRKRDGKIDFNYANILCDFTSPYLYTPIPVDYHSDLLKRFLSNNQDQKNVIIKDLLEFSKHYPVNEEDLCFAYAFGFCYNTKTNKYEHERYEALKDFSKEAEKRLEFDFDNMDEILEEYKRWENAAIWDFFEANTDEKTGSLIKKPISAKEFLKNY